MKKTMHKKPDLVVFNEETQQYDAALKPYGTSASSPVIKPQILQLGQQMV